MDGQPHIRHSFDIRYSLFGVQKGRNGDESPVLQGRKNLIYSPDNETRIVIGHYQSNGSCKNKTSKNPHEEHEEHSAAFGRNQCISHGGAETRRKTTEENSVNSVAPREAI